MSPDELKVKLINLLNLLKYKSIGIVAKFYIVLTACCTVECLTSIDLIPWLWQIWMSIYHSARCGFYVGTCACNLWSGWLWKGIPGFLILFFLFNECLLDIISVFFLFFWKFPYIISYNYFMNLCAQAKLLRSSQLQIEVSPGLHSMQAFGSI